MIRPSNMYLNYKITNKFICKVIEKDFNGKWKLRLNPHRYFLNRTNYKFWVSNIEVVELQCATTYTYTELTNLRNHIINHLNIIILCVNDEEHNSIKDIELKIN